MNSFRLKLALLVGTITAALLLAGGFFRLGTYRTLQSRPSRPGIARSRQGQPRTPRGQQPLVTRGRRPRLCVRHRPTAVLRALVKNFDREEYRSARWPAGISRRSFPRRPPTRAASPSLPCPHRAARANLPQQPRPSEQKALLLHAEANSKHLADRRPGQPLHHARARGQSRRIQPRPPAAAAPLSHRPALRSAPARRRRLVSRHRALRPVTALTQAAERITARGLDQRIAAPAHDREFGAPRHRVQRDDGPPRKRVSPGAPLQRRCFA